ncbi:MAG: hypothetical protein AMXMBFR23_22620 [Chloroflexota bacterium]
MWGVGASPFVHSTVVPTTTLIEGSVKFAIVALTTAAGAAGAAFPPDGAAAEVGEAAALVAAGVED